MPRGIGDWPDRLFSTAGLVLQRPSSVIYVSGLIAKKNDGDTECLRRFPSNSNSVSASVCRLYDRARNGSGSTGLAPWRSSKCTCGLST